MIGEDPCVRRNGRRGAVDKEAGTPSLVGRMSIGREEERVGEGQRRYRYHPGQEFSLQVPGSTSDGKWWRGSSIEDALQPQLITLKRCC